MTKFTDFPSEERRRIAVAHLDAIKETAKKFDDLPKDGRSTMLDRPEWAWLKQFFNKPRETQLPE